jgi:hypothetical protein
MLNKKFLWIPINIVAIFLIWLFSKSSSEVKMSENSFNGKSDSTNNIAVLEISLQKGKDFILYILLHSDGTINRSGMPNETFTGAKENSSKEVYMGQSDDKILKEMITYLTLELVNDKGEHNLGGSGEKLDLNIVLKIEDRGMRSKYTYGSESSGPPIFVKNFLNKAVELTDKWVLEIKKK